MQNRTAVHILQHPAERFHPVGTVRLARLGLARVTVEVHWPGDGRAPRLQDRLSAGAGLLFPAPGAEDLMCVPAARRPSELVLLDGTWSTVRALYRANGWLAALPHYRVVPNSPSGYRIRKEPRAYCLSTIEALVAALRILEPDTRGLDALLGAFDDMVARQENFVRAAESPRQRRPLSPRQPPVPAVLRRGMRNLVAVYGEVVPAPADSSAGRKELCHWVATRLSDGATFACLILPETGQLADRHRQHMGLTAADVAAACTSEEFVARWQAFVRPSDVLVCWRHLPLQALARVCKVKLCASVVLKAVYCNLQRCSCGHLDDVVARAGLTPHATPPSRCVRGRAARRLADTAAVLRWIVGRAALHADSG